MFLKLRTKPRERTLKYSSKPIDTNIQPGKTMAKKHFQIKCWLSPSIQSSPIKAPHLLARRHWAIQSLPGFIRGLNEHTRNNTHMYTPAKKKTPINSRLPRQRSREQSPRVRWPGRNERFGKCLFHHVNQKTQEVQAVAKPNTEKGDTFFFPSGSGVTFLLCKTSLSHTVPRWSKKCCCVRTLLNFSPYLKWRSIFYNSGLSKML